MMKNIYRAFAKKLFGVRYERIGRTFLAELILFLSLRTSGLQIQIAPSVLYLTTAAFTAGIMWQALSSTDNNSYMEHMLMLPFDGCKFVSAYVGALGFYTLITKTAMLWAVVFAVSSWTASEIFTSILYALNSILITGNVFAMMNRHAAETGSLKIAGLLGTAVLFWEAGLIASVFLPAAPVILTVLPGISAILAAILLGHTDAYHFYRRADQIPQTVAIGPIRALSIWRYFFRYLTAHRNYLINTAAMCGIACVLPLLFDQTDGSFALPIGFAILSMNTPLCILLSCDPALEQAVRFLPGQKRAFCVPYCTFIFIVNLLVETVFLCSLAIHSGGFHTWYVPTAVYFALQSAVGSVWLEWFHPIRNWKIESDLWHHPRKYIVPGSMVLIAGLIGACL